MRYFKHPVSQKEEVFVNIVVAHIGTVFYAIENDLVVEAGRVRRDVAQFLSLRFRVRFGKR